MLHRRQLLAAGLTGAAAIAAVRPAEAMPVVARPQAQALVGRPVAAVELSGKTNAAAFALRSAAGVLTDAPARLAMRARADGLRATGSGFFIDAEGHLLTCAHVLEGASTIAVRLPEGGQAPARLVGADAVSDIAVLHVENRGNSPHLFLSAEDHAEPGDEVLAIGDPLGYAASVTRGIVSATGRRYRAEDALRYVQHDAAVNRGSSGGALVDEAGRLVGMNAAIADGSFGFAGIAFAIPVSVLTRIAAELIETGGVLRGEAGLTVQQLDPALAEGLGLDRAAAGLAVATVKAGGAAARAGIAVGDILVSCGATPLAEPADLGETLLWSKPGERVSVSLLRNGATLISTVLELDPARAVAAPRIEVATRGMPQRLDFGARFRPGAGLTVAEVTPQGAAERAGLLEGDRILAAAGRPLADPAAFEALWRDFGRPSMTLLVAREGDNAQYVAVSCYENADGLSGNVTASPPVAF